MKLKSLILAMFLTLGMASSFANVTSNPIGEGSVEVTFKIGRKSKGCTGIGICKIEKVKVIIKDIKFRQQSDDTLVKAKLTSVNGKMVLSVDKENLEIVKKHFKDVQLIMEEAFDIDDIDILKDLSIDKFSIKEGIYKFEYNSKNSSYDLHL